VNRRTGEVAWCDPVGCAAVGCTATVCRGEGLGTNARAYDRAVVSLPGGVNSPIRAYKGVGGTPRFVARASGASVWDLEGREYLDLVQSYGAIILGHAHPATVAAVTSAVALGTSYGAPTVREVRLAEAICQRVPSVEMVRLVNSGTEATMSAIRLARGATGRNTVVKFAGNYHGHGDALLAESGSALAVLGIPGSAGVTEQAVSQTMVVPYNTVPALDTDVACVVVEPVAANMGLVAPAAGFLDGLRAECDRVGALLVFDEVITGFRLGPGGAQGAFGVRPDLTCFGKVIGGGLPIGAFGGRRDVMEALAPVGPVFQAGTLSGNPLATAAGLAALDLLTADVYAALDGAAAALAAGIDSALRGAGLTGSAPRVGTLVGLHLSDTPAVDYDTARTTDTSLYAALFHELLDLGVMAAPGAYEVMFPGAAHTPEVVESIVDRFALACGRVAERR
jgi:glutamate-1-semialdehyde 2,1-aminomutase